MAFGLGGSSNKSSSSSESYGFDQSQTYIDPRSAAQQQQLLNRFNNEFNQLGQAPGLNWNRVDTQQQLRQNALGQGIWGGIAAQQGRQGMNQLAQFQQFGNPYLQQQINGLAQDAGQFYREQVLPGIGSQAQLAGQRGSSRQGIAEALGAQRVGQEFMQSANQLRSNAYGMQQQAATDMANLGYGTAGQMWAQGAQSSYNQGQLANQFANTGYAGQMLPFEIGQSIVGSPQVLSQSFGMDYSKAKSKGKGSSLNVGLK